MYARFFRSLRAKKETKHGLECICVSERTIPEQVVVRKNNQSFMYIYTDRLVDG